VKQTEYVEAARALGVSEVRLGLTHVLRNCLAPLIVAITLNIGGMITALAGLSFLGLDVQPPTADWAACWLRAASTSTWRRTSPRCRASRSS
jgi:ABC-type dipeptide/oligopeptide/nickel transport system permease subunit